MITCEHCFCQTVFVGADKVPHDQCCMCETRRVRRGGKP